MPSTGMPSSKIARSDRKSTRLNSSHLGISYAVFCLKKKKKLRRIADHVPIRRNTLRLHRYCPSIRVFEMSCRDFSNEPVHFFDVIFFFFFFKETGPPRDLPSSPPRRFSD